jgi:hypothetical protein
LTYTYSATGQTTQESFYSSTSGGQHGHFEIAQGGGGNVPSPIGHGPGSNDDSQLNWTFGFDVLNRKITATAWVP